MFCLRLICFLKKSRSRVLSGPLRYSIEVLYVMFSILFNWAKIKF